MPSPGAWVSVTSKLATDSDVIAWCCDVCAAASNWSWALFVRLATLDMSMLAPCPTRTPVVRPRTIFVLLDGGDPRSSPQGQACLQDFLGAFAAWLHPCAARQHRSLQGAVVRGGSSIRALCKGPPLLRSVLQRQSRGAYLYISSYYVPSHALCFILPYKFQS